MSFAWFNSAITAANTSRTGIGTANFVFTAKGAAQLRFVYFLPHGTNVKTVARIFLNNGGDNTVPQNNSLIAEIDLPATVASADEALEEQILDATNAGIVLTKKQRIFVVLGTQVSAGYQVNIVMGG